MLKFTNMKKGKYQMAVNSISGTLLSSWVLQHSGGSNTYHLQLNANWSAGSYIVKVTGEDGDNLVGDRECRQDQHINLGMAEDPEEMRPHDRHAAGLGIEEMTTKVTVDGEHDLGRRQRTDGHQDHP